jgi:hypothetical protein
MGATAWARARLAFGPAYAAALLAVALLSFAPVQSAVMQAAGPATAWPICSADGSGKSAPQSPADQAAHTVCGFCAAAGEAALLSVAAPIPAPVVVAWTPRPAVPSRGPRGPPRFRPRARAPPSSLRTA